MLLSPAGGAACPTQPGTPARTTQDGYKAAHFLRKVAFSAPLNYINKIRYTPHDRASDT
jgi:hypothetical protein